MGERGLQKVWEKKEFIKQKNTLSMRQPIKSGRDNERSMAGQQQGVRQQPLAGEGRQEVAGDAASDPTKPVFNKKALRIPRVWPVTQ